MQRRMHRSFDGTPSKSPFIRPHLNGGDEEDVTRPKSPLAFSMWALLLFGVCILLVFMRLLSGSSPTSHSFYNQDALHPINYLNGTAVHPPPFNFCPIHGPGDVVGNKYGAHAMAMSRLHLGSGARIQRLIHRAMSGQPVTISVLGGSITSCHGAGDDPLAANCWPARFFVWWNSIFPHPASQITNGARRRTDSSYFAFCHGHHLPDETDLVILDFDTEDQNDKQALDHFELLVRSILNRRDSPAIIVLGHFSPQLQTAFGFGGPDHQHSVVAQYYDLPHLSVKGIMYHDYLSDPDEYQHTYHADPVLANSNGHELLSDVLISYFQHQICKGWDAAWGHAFDVPLLSIEQGDRKGMNGLLGGMHPNGGGVVKGAVGEGQAKNNPRAKGGDLSPGRNPFRTPRGRLASRPWDLPKMIEAQPFCVAADDLINPLPPSLFYGSGWHVYHPKGGDDNLHYWYSTLPSSKLRISIKVGAGDVA
ncbi:cap64-like protein, partial [Serendipita sp. 400]